MLGRVDLRCWIILMIDDVGMLENVHYCIICILLTYLISITKNNRSQYFPRVSVTFRNLNEFYEEAFATAITRTQHARMRRRTHKPQGNVKKFFALHVLHVLIPSQGTHAKN